MVEPLTETLADRHDAVRRLTAQVLGEVGDVRAILPLVDAMMGWPRDLRWAPHEALVVIVGEDLGEDMQGWVQWWAAHQ